MPLIVKEENRPFVIGAGVAVCTFAIILLILIIVLFTQNTEQNNRLDLIAEDEDELKELINNDDGNSTTLTNLIKKARRRIDLVAKDENELKNILGVDYSTLTSLIKSVESRAQFHRATVEFSGYFDVDDSKNIFPRFVGDIIKSSGFPSSLTLEFKEGRLVFKSTDTSKIISVALAFSYYINGTIKNQPLLSATSVGVYSETYGSRTVPFIWNVPQVYGKIDEINMAYVGPQTYPLGGEFNTADFAFLSTDPTAKVTNKHFFGTGNILNVDVYGVFM